MKITIDESKFDVRQHKLIELIIRSIIEEAKVYVNDESDLAQLTDNIAFSIASMLDGSTVMEVDNETLKPFLTFSSDENSKKLIAAEGGSWMHEYVMGWADDIIFEDGDDDFLSAIRISLGVGIKHKTSIYKSSLESVDELAESIEYLLNIKQRSKTFEEVVTRRKEIQSIGFSSSEHADDEEWEEHVFTKNNHGNYDYSAKGIAQFIIEQVKS